MKNPLIMALVCALNAGLPCICAQQAKETTNDVLVEAPPGAVPGAPSTSPAGSKPKRLKSNSNSTTSRHGATAEIKAFSFNHAFAPERLSRALIIRSGKADAKTTVQLQEDLAIMSRILEKSAAEYRDEREEAAGIPILALGGGKAIRALYLEDYGVLFTLNVNIPLQPEPKVEQAVDKPDSAANEEWTDARNELFGDRRTLLVRGERPPRRDFDQHQLDEFRDNLIEALRNAANIRNLRDTDWITIVVRGRGSAPDPDAAFDVIVQNRYGANTRETYAPYGPVAIGSPDERTESSTMVLRIMKRSLDEFTHQKGSPEDFRRRVKVALY